MRNSGITLVALIVTIIVMIILAGVTITTLVSSDESAIKNVEESYFLNSSTQIEKWINELYVKYYAKLPNAEDKAMALIEYFESDTSVDQNGKVLSGGSKKMKENFKLDGTKNDNIFHKKADGTWQYEIDSKKFYCLNSKNLKKVVSSDVNVLDIDDNYSNSKDIKGTFGVSPDLRVFYIVEWSSSRCEILGIEKDDIN